MMELLGGKSGPPENLSANKGMLGTFLLFSSLAWSVSRRFAAFV